MESTEEMYIREHGMRMWTSVVMHYLQHGRSVEEAEEAATTLLDKFNVKFQK